MGEGRWLARYRAGERAAVWHELRQLGARVREPEVIDEATAVCDEMARRARHNVERVVERLIPGGTGDPAGWAVRRRLAEGLLPL